MNSQLSIARFYGGIKFNGEKYVIVPPKNDLILSEWVPVYKKLGRDKTIKLIKEGMNIKEVMAKINVEQLKLDL